jgi:hypothetical protein
MSVCKLCGLVLSLPNTVSDALIASFSLLRVMVHAYSLNKSITAKVR